jgi:hypothetical protein
MNQPSVLFCVVSTKDEVKKARDDYAKKAK